MGPAKDTGKSRSFPSRFRYLFLLAVVCGGSFVIFTISNTNSTNFLKDESPTWTPKPRDRSTLPEDEETYTIKTPGCTIPCLKPFDKSIKKFIKRPEIAPCRNSNTSLLDSNDTHIWIKMESVQYYSIPKDVNLTCCYKAFYRPSVISDITSLNVDDRAQYETCIEFTSDIEVVNEFVKVSCGFDHKTIYDQFFLFAPKKIMMNFPAESTEARLNQTSYNVIVMGIDAISRLNFYRTMPKTLTFLKTKGAIELLGYNKVGDNTFPNLTPMLMGVKDTELKKVCWPHIHSSFDNCPFVWEWFKDAGYYTALGEDSAKLGTFNFGKTGFIGNPTDYYIHTFMHEAETHVGNNRDYNTFICMGNKYFYQVLLDYAEALTRTLKGSKLFGFFWEVTLSHDYLNYPMVMDDSYEKFFKALDESKYLDETIFILLSDHGIRWGDIRYTKQGRLEERLPFVHILLPPSFRQNYKLAYKNIMHNNRRLTTPYDMHATLLDLIDLNEVKDERIESRSKENYASRRSISLFLPIPNNRTCKIADIDDHWCTCHKSSKVPVDSRYAQEAAHHLVKHLNILVRDQPQCAHLMLVEVLDANELMVGTPRKNEQGWRELMVVVRTLPGAGVFEATLRLDGARWALAGTVSRLNVYGDQSRCVEHYQLKLYCYCHSN